MSINHNHKWKYKNLTVVLIGIIFAIILSHLKYYRHFLSGLSIGGYQSVKEVYVSR